MRDSPLLQYTLLAAIIVGTVGLILSVTVQSLAFALLFTIGLVFLMVAAQYTHNRENRVESDHDG